MYNTPYINSYNQQANIDRINAQISELEKMRTHMQQPIQQPTNLTQNFQLAPNNNSFMRYANNIEEIQKEFVVGETPFFSKDLSVLWIKNAKGEIKSYELNEIVEKDEKDMQIELLQAQINDLKGMIKNDANVTNVNAEQNATNTTRNDNKIRTTIKKNEPTSFQKIQRS